MSGRAVGTSGAGESFRDLLLRFRGRSGLTQGRLAQQIGVARRSVQDWESGVNRPTAERLERVLVAMLEAGGLAAGHEAEDAQALWDAVQHGSSRTYPAFDKTWFDRLLAERADRSEAPGPLGAETGAHVHDETAARRQEWGDAPDPSRFIGRTQELKLLRQWVLDDHCRVVTLLGMGGIGKTCLGARLAHDVAASFERVYWRGVRLAPPPGEWLAGAIGFLSDHAAVPPNSESEQIGVLLNLLREHRCLLVLDNFEALFEPGQLEARYLDGLGAYGRVLEALAEATHQGCLVLTSREAPPELSAVLGGPARSLRLGGLAVEEAQALLADKGLVASSQQWAELTERFGGNGLALKLAGETIRELFSGNVGSFIQLEEPGASSTFGGIRRLLSEQIERSSSIEQRVLRALAVAREPMTFAALSSYMSDHAGSGPVLAAVEALRRRSLVEPAETHGAAALTVQSVVLEYVTERLVNEVSDEISSGAPVLLLKQPLISAQTQDYVRQSQELLIGGPILRWLKAQYGEQGAEARLLALLEKWRGQPGAEQGYGPGNVVNLLRSLRSDLRGIDMARLSIRQAYLADISAQDASLVDAHLTESVLAEAFDFPSSVALSPNGVLLAAGTSTGQVRLWSLSNRVPLWAVQAHSGGVVNVALSANDRLVASGGGDGIVGLWDAGTGRPFATLLGHSGAVRGVALSADGLLVASGGHDGTVRLWDSATGRLIAALEGHTGAVWRVALSADGHLIASGGDDGYVRLWSLTGITRRDGMLGIQEDPKTARRITALEAHTGAVWRVALSADGRLVASGGTDGTVRVWSRAHITERDGMRGIQEDAAGSDEWRPLAILPNHAGAVSALAVSADGRLVASGDEDGTLRVWEVATQRPMVTARGHTGFIGAASFSADGYLLATGGADGTVRVWSLTSVTKREGMLGIQEEAITGRPTMTLRGNTDGIWTVAQSGDPRSAGQGGRLVASAGTDGIVRLWSLTDVTKREGMLGIQQDSSIGQPLRSLGGHHGAVWSVALSQDGRLIAGGGTDGVVRLWSLTGVSKRDGVPGIQEESSSGRLLHSLSGHAGGVWGVALSGDGLLVASGGVDGTVRLWDTNTGQPLGVLTGHVGAVWRVAVSRDGTLVASAGSDGTLRLWDSSSGRPLGVLTGHVGAIWSVALSAPGDLLASCGEDGTVRLWSLTGLTQRGGNLGIQEGVMARRQSAVLLGHTGAVLGVALSADGRLVASGAADQTLRLWEVATGRLLAILSGHTEAVSGVALSADGTLVASGSWDGGVKLWDAQRAVCVRTLRAERRYERMDVTGLTGITEAQRQTLAALGATDRSAQP